MAGAQGEQRAAMLDHYDSLLQMPRASELDEVCPCRVSTAQDLSSYRMQPAPLRLHASASMTGNMMPQKPQHAAIFSYLDL